MCLQKNNNRATILTFGYGLAVGIALTFADSNEAPTSHTTESTI
ncbi:hypothetical protein OCA16_19510 [Bacillus cereus]|nr:hypothetical protein [Bacillus cereus]